MHAASGHAHAPSLARRRARADKEEDELIQMRRAIARLEEEEANLAREMSAALLELGTQVQRETTDIRLFACSMYDLVIACLHRSIYQVQRLRDDFKKEESADGDAENSTGAPLKS